MNKQGNLKIINKTKLSPHTSNNQDTTITYALQCQTN